MNTKPVCFWGFCLLGLLLLSVPGGLPAARAAGNSVDNGSRLEETWRFGSMGRKIGDNSLCVADLDGDGQDEIICSASYENRWDACYWFVLEYSAVLEEYIYFWGSPWYHSSISAITTAPTASEGGYEIYVARQDGVVEVYDGTTLVRQRSLYTGKTKIRQMIFADADNDGETELVFAAYAGVFLANFMTGIVEQEVTGCGGHICVGNVDEDEALEICGSEGTVQQLNGDLLITEWDYPGGYWGPCIGLADVDADGTLELIGFVYYDYLCAFDVELHSPKWQLRIDCYPGEFWITDLVMIKSRIYL